MPFGPPLNPAKKCGSIKPVMMRTSASDEMTIDQRRHATARDAKLDVRVRVFRLVIQAAIIRDDLGSQQLLEFGLCIWTMRAEGIEERDILARGAGVFQIREQPRDEPLIRSGAGAVGVDDRDARARRDAFPKRRSSDGIFQCSHEAGVLILQAGLC